MTRRDDLAYAAGLAVGALGLLLFGVVDLRIQMLAIDDLATIWVGPRAFVLGIDPYDPLTWRDVAVRIGTAHVPDHLVYAYPPWVTVALAPLAYLSSRDAGIAWTVASLVLAIVAVRSLLRAYLPGMPWAHAVVGFLLLLSAPGAITFITGQWTYIFVAAIAAMVLLLRAGQPVTAGIVAAVMLAKPPLFLFTAPVLALRAAWHDGPVPRGRWFVATALVTGAALVAVAWVLLPSWWPAWLIHVAAVQVGITPVTVQTLLVAILGPTGGWLAPVVVLLATWVALQFDPRGDAWLPVGLALSSMNAIYANTYDALLLLVPMVLAAGAVRARSPRRAAVVIGSMAVLLFAVGWYLHTLDAPRLYAAVVPVGAYVVVAGALWPWRRATGSAASARGNAGSSPR